MPARWQRLIGAEVTIEQADGLVRICHAGGEVACHPVLRGRRERAIDPAYLAGIVVATPQPVPPPVSADRRDGHRRRQR